MTQAQQKSPRGRRIELKGSVTVARPAQELYRVWRNLENLPRFISHLASVKETDETRSRWVMRAPAGVLVEWTAETFEERQGERLGWRSLKGTEVSTHGAVDFETLDAQSTKVTLALAYHLPADAVGEVIAGLFGDAPEGQLEEDLDLFKQLAEAQELAGEKQQEPQNDSVVAEASKESFPASDPPTWTGTRSGGPAGDAEDEN
ncbi:MAG: SRPBCC family protein [Deinococcota bacterium]|nr:SRPBCC family protein [Deinococcota bacterium]